MSARQSRVPRMKQPMSQGLDLAIGLCGTGAAEGADAAAVSARLYSAD